MRRSADTAARFWSKVNKVGPTVRQELGPCWVWLGAPTRHGYGELGIAGRKKKSAHRLSWELANGPIPTGNHVLHSCDHRLCVRPSHLFIGTNADNMRDKIAKGRQHRGEKTGGALLTEAKVTEILAAFATGEFSQCTLALEYGVSNITVRDIVIGATWAHVEGPRLSRSEIVAIGKRNRALGRYGPVRRSA